MSASTLLPVERLGDGPDIESLPSYLFRLTSEHEMSVDQLVKFLAQHAKKQDRPQFTFAPIAASATLVRPNSTTEWVIRELHAHSTISQDKLRAMTFLALLKLERPSRCFSSDLRGCPSCLSADLADGRPRYLRLSWLLCDVMACMSHGLQLQSRCPQCSARQGSLARWSDMGRCQKCGQPLHKASPALVRSKDPGDFAPDLLDLVKRIATDPSFQGCAESARRCLTRAVRGYWLSEHEQTLIDELPRDEVAGFCSGARPMTLLTARRLAYRLEMSIADFVTNEACVQGAFGFAAELPPPVQLAAMPRRCRLNVEALEKQFDQAIEDTRSPAPSLAKIAAGLGVSTGALRYYFKDKVEVIVKAWSRSIEEEKRRMRRSMRNSVKRAVATWASKSDSPISIKGVFQVLRQSGRYPKHQLRECIVDVLSKQSQ